MATAKKQKTVEIPDLAPASRETLGWALRAMRGRLAICRVKSDTINRADTKLKSQGLLDRLAQLIEENDNPNMEFQNIERHATEIMEDIDTLERGTGVSPR